jgi:hypothetical protein
MKTLTLYGFTTILLVGVTTLAFAQSNTLQTPLQRQATRYEMKQAMFSQWGESSIAPTVQGVIAVAGGEVFGIPEEQSQRFFDYERDPDIQSIHRELNRLSSEMPDGAFAENASEETQKRYLDLRVELDNLRREKVNDLVNEILTPDQQRKVKEFQIATMDSTSLVSLDMFEVLGISDDQKKQLEEIKNELKPEVEKQIDKMVEHQLFYQEKVDEAIGDKLNGITDPAERMKIIMDVLEKFNEKYPEFSQGTTEYLESGKSLTNNLKIKMFDVLTDEQWDRMLDLIDNPPDHVKKYFEVLHKAMGGNTSRTNSSQTKDVWSPGPGSWQPGDPIPEKYRQERNEKRNFPRPRAAE